MKIEHFWKKTPYKNMEVILYLKNITATNFFKVNIKPDNKII